MRAVCQRVTRASVHVESRPVGKIGAGLLVFLGVGPDDNRGVARAMAKKIAGLRIFADETGRMNHSLQEVAGECLVVSQFTLYGDCKNGRRPFFGGAAQPDLARTLCDEFCSAMAELVTQVQTGEFGAMMNVSLVNDGPVTLLLDSQELGMK